MVQSGRKTIRIWFVDFWKGLDLDENYFTNILRKYYHVTLDAQNPDLIFCSVFYSGLPEALRYSCTKIFYTGENIRPDFQVYDYAIGFDYIFKDRYLRWPLYRLFCEDFEVAKEKHCVYNIERFMERDFCCRVVSNEQSEFRERLFMEMDKKFAKGVASGGKGKNNLPGGKCIGKSLKDKRDFLSAYKFNLAMENSNTPGYVTEKIIQAWSAGCIPVYWGGGGRIGEEFNKEAFVDCGDFSTIPELLDYLDELQYDREMLEHMLQAPIFNKDQNREEGAVESFLKHIIDGEIG